MVKEALGAKIKTIRIGANLTQEELAQRSGLAIRFVQDIEAGNKQPSITTVFKLADGLKVSITDLLQDVYKAWIKSGKPE